jgi:hypothetical protein
MIKEYLKDIAGVAWYWSNASDVVFYGGLRGAAYPWH